jgi:hypothetical protein
MKFNGSAWEQVGAAGFSAGVASFTSLALDNNDTPYVAYMDGANGTESQRDEICRTRRSRAPLAKPRLQMAQRTFLSPQP